MDSGSLFVCRATALKCPVRRKILLSCAGVIISFALLGLIGPGTPAPGEAPALAGHTAASESQELAWVQVSHKRLNQPLPERGASQLGRQRRYAAGVPAYD
jgi:hypothetical protein